MPQLNASIYTLIFLHIHEFDCIRRAIEAVSLSKKHPLRHVLLRKLLNRDIFLSSRSYHIQQSESLISFLIENPHLAERIQTVWLTLDADSSSDDSNDDSSYDSSDDHSGSASEIEAINLRLAKMTQNLLKEMRGLKTIEWRGAPGPDEECLRMFAGLERLEKFAIDCVCGERMNWNDMYKYLGYVPFHFSCPVVG
jgi:hypothetical protein